MPLEQLVCRVNYARTFWNKPMECNQKKFVSWNIAGSSLNEIL